MKVPKAEARSRVEREVSDGLRDEVSVQLRRSPSVPWGSDAVQLKAGRSALLTRPAPRGQLQQVNALRALAQDAVQMQSLSMETDEATVDAPPSLQQEERPKYKRIKENGRIKVVDAESGAVMRDIQTEEGRRQALAKRYVERINGKYLEVVDTQTGKVMRKTVIEALEKKEQAEQTFERVNGKTLEVVDRKTGKVVRKTRIQGADLEEEEKGAATEEVEAVQEKSANQAQPSRAASVRHHAAQGVRGAGAAMPHLETIQASFGRHDVSAVQAYVGGAAREATQAMGAEAYATGDKVAFGGTPTLHTAAHEAAHVVQQRAGVQLKGGVGQVGDVYEQHADAVADLVVQGKSAEALLSSFVSEDGQEAVQLKDDPLGEGGGKPEVKSEEEPVGETKQARIEKLYAAQEMVKSQGYDVRISPDGPDAFHVVVSSGEVSRAFSDEEFILHAPALRAGFLTHRSPDMDVELDSSKMDTYNLEVRFNITLAQGSRMVNIPGLGVVQTDIKLVWITSMKHSGNGDSAASLNVHGDNGLENLTASLKSAFGSCSLKATPDGGAYSLSFPVCDVSMSGGVGVSTKGWSASASMKPRPVTVAGVTGGLQGSLKLSQSWDQCMAPGLLAAYKTAQIGVESSAAQRFEEWVLQQDHQKWMLGLLAGTALVVVGIPLAASTTSAVAGMAATAEGAAVAQGLAGAAPALATAR